MTIYKSTEEKLSQLKNRKALKPYIDRNLQLQISPNPIFSHFISSADYGSFYQPDFDEEQLYKAMQNAHSSFEAWKKMRDQIKANLGTQLSNKKDSTA